MFKSIIERFKSPAVWVGISSLITLIFTTAGVKLSQLTSWSIVGETLLNIIKNPFTLGSVAVAIFVFLNNPTNKKGF